ncbi:hypothetical protein [uncultured Cytophaga sp.]|uniref:hypothetical protein n=1 Tax=uncultured Cytophaga sp. TaxID=160238 RepID=UPI002622466A|nr:hypothetical protein [uncultured Cytophaga sp.]
MDELEINYQAVYYHPMNIKGLSMNLLTFGFRQFATTKRIEKIDLIKKLSDDYDPTTSPKVEDFQELIFEQLVDTIKITICFENLMKAKLLLTGHVIHKLDKNIFPELYKEQFARPILFNEIRAIKDWEINSKIKTDQVGLKNYIHGILKNTLGMKELLSSRYIEIMNLDEDILSLCKRDFEYRNNVHYYIQEKLSIGKQSYFDLTKIIDFVNDEMVNLQNQLVDNLNVGENRKIKKIPY